MKKGDKHYKWYREGYNNSLQFNHELVVKNNSDEAKAVIKGIIDRHQDDIDNTTEYKK